MVGVGTGHLDIGEGLGGAQVFGHTPAIAQLGQMLAQRKAKEDADNKYLAEQLTSVKPDGLRNDADRANFFDKYSKVKQLAIDAENEKDPKRRALDIANVRQSIMDLNSYVDESKKQAAKENLFAQAYMTNPTAFSDQAIAAHRKSIQSAVDSPDVVKDYTQLARQVDATKIEQEQAKREQELLKLQQWGTPTIKNTTVAGRKGSFIYNSREVPKDVLYEDALHRATADPNFDRFLQQAYPDAYQGKDRVTGRALAVKTYIDSRPEVAEYSKPEEKQSLAPQRPSWLEEWYLSHYGVPLNPNSGAAQSMEPTYRQVWVNDMLSGKPGSGEILKAKVAADPTWNGKLDIGALPDGKIVFNLPTRQKYVPATATSDGHWEAISTPRRVIIDPKDPNARVKLNELTNEITGEKVDISSLQTPGGKKHVPGASLDQSVKPKEINPNKSYKASNGRSYSHSELKKMGYTDEQIQQAIKLGNLK